MDDSDGGGIAFLLFIAGPATTVGIWMWIYARYRNKNARYRPDVVVHHDVIEVKENDAKTGNLVSKQSSIQGRNDKNHHVRAPSYKAIKH